MLEPDSKATSFRGVGRGLDRCEGDEGSEGIGEVLLVLRKPTVSTEPRESALDHPAARQHTKPFMSSDRLAISM
jgi:hypothetical protein